MGLGGVRVETIVMLFVAGAGAGVVVVRAVLVAAEVATDWRSDARRDAADSPPEEVDIGAVTGAGATGLLAPPPDSMPKFATPPATVSNCSSLSCSSCGISFDMLHAP